MVVERKSHVAKEHSPTEVQDLALTMREFMNGMSNASFSEQWLRDQVSQWLDIVTAVQHNKLTPDLKTEVAKFEAEKLRRDLIRKQQEVAAIEANIARLEKVK